LIAPVGRQGQPPIREQLPLAQLQHQVLLPSRALLPNRVWLPIRADSLRRERRRLDHLRREQLRPERLRELGAHSRQVLNQRSRAAQAFPARTAKELRTRAEWMD